MSLDGDVETFLKAGGKVQLIPAGVGKGQKTANRSFKDSEDKRLQLERNKALPLQRQKAEFCPKRYGKI